jgi:hypothetical protein
MTRRALVFGSQIEGLRGVDNDTRLVAELLRSHNFEVDLRVGEKATRASILAGYDHLIEMSSPDDAAVVYYSGHGFHASLPGGPRWQCIAPFDLREGGVRDWRGITAWELSIKQEQLTRKTRNVTVILDCCHSSQMSRDAAVRCAIPRALPHPARVGFFAHLEVLREMYGAAFDDVQPDGNADAVRLVACGQLEAAFEYPDDSGEYHGAFTEALVDVMGKLGPTEVSWSSIAEAIRAIVVARFALQRPDVEGPARRRPFSLTEDDGSGVVAINSTGGSFGLPVGHLMGVVLGDVFGVMPAGSGDYDRKRAIAEVEVTEVMPVAASARLRQWRNGHERLPAGAVAIPIARNARKRAVAVEAPDADRDRIREAISACPTLRNSRPGEETAALAIVRLRDGALTISDPLGPLFPAAKFPEELDDTVKNVANLGVAQSIRELTGQHGVFEDELAIDLGVLENGHARDLPAHGCALGLRDRIYVKVRNKGHRQLYVHVFNIGVRGRVKLLTSFAPAGVMLNGGDPDFVLGRSADGTLQGLGLTWPDGLPMDGFPRVDEIAVIATTSQTSLRTLETHEHLTRSAVRRSGGTRLQSLLAQLQDGIWRDAGDETPTDGFLVKLLSFMLHPRQGALGGLHFEVDENPSGLAAAREPGAWVARGIDVIPTSPPPGESTAPEAIAIRIAELVVEKNRALFSADIRVDALVCTRSADAQAGHTSWTQKYSGIRDGERLSLENGLLFLGPVRDFVDITLWVSRDAEGSLELARLLAQRATSPEFKDAAAALLIGVGPVASPWVTAVGASAVLARIAYELVLGVAGKSIGLYRTSFLARERFGVGRLTPESLYRAQDFSFSLSIEPVTMRGA